MGVGFEGEALYFCVCVGAGGLGAAAGGWWQGCLFFGGGFNPVGSWFCETV